jgi:hypothetical protein
VAGGQVVGQDQVQDRVAQLDGLLGLERPRDAGDRPQGPMIASAQRARRSSGGRDGSARLPQSRSAKGTADHSSQRRPRRPPRGSARQRGGN